MSFQQFFSENILLFIGLLISCAAIVIYEFKNRGKGGASISGVLAARMMNDGAIMIDTRPHLEFIKGHIAGAKNHPAESFKTQLTSLKIKKDKAIIVCCRSGITAKKQAVMLRDSGYQEVYVLDGGIDNWRNDNLPTVKGNQAKSNHSKGRKKS